MSSASEPLWGWRVNREPQECKLLQCCSDLSCKHPRYTLHPSLRSGSRGLGKQTYTQSLFRGGGVSALYVVSSG